MPFVEEMLQVVEACSSRYRVVLQLQHMLQLARLQGIVAY